MRPPSWLLWTFAFLLTLSAAIYQRLTGPSYPVRGCVTIGTEEVAFKLPRSHGGEGDEEIRLPVPDETVTGTIDFQRFRSHDAWSRHPLERRGEVLVARIPHQPPAGKVMYRILLETDAGDSVTLTPEPVIIRFRGDVPAYVLIPHIILMFAGMLASTRTGLEALSRRPNTFRLAIWTAILLPLGGLIGGPIVQKFAFGAFWTGWPFGYDLTDNKTAIAFLFWLLAIWRMKKKPPSRGWAIAASLVLLAAYFTPHSLLGSERDYTEESSPSAGRAHDDATCAECGGWWLDDVPVLTVCARLGLQAG